MGIIHFLFILLLKNLFIIIWFWAFYENSFSEVTSKTFIFTRSCNFIFSTSYGTLFNLSTEI